jgi:hypothetical protein
MLQRDPKLSWSITCIAFLSLTVLLLFEWLLVRVPNLGSSLFINGGGRHKCRSRLPPSATWTLFASGRIGSTMLLLSQCKCNPQSFKLCMPSTSAMALFSSQIHPQILLCKKKIPHHIKILANAWSTKCR